uniref:Myb-like protein D isoform X2 n=1 Tax=Diabrotica virgifera virgifera TaxID=50390 RepID=A0A6P7FT66_DIAVI
MKHEHFLRSKSNAKKHRPRECVSESSFLSDNFCSIILGKPGNNLMKKKILAVGEGDFHKILNNKNSSLHQQQVLLCDVEPVTNSKSFEINDKISPTKNDLRAVMDKNKIIKSNIDSNDVNKSTNYNQKILNRSSKIKKERKPRDLVEDSAKFQIGNKNENDTYKTDNNNNNKYSENARQKSVRDEVSYKSLISDLHPELLKTISETQNGDKGPDLSVRNAQTSQMIRLHSSKAEVFLPDQIIHSKQQFGNNKILSDADLNQYSGQDKSKKDSYESNSEEKTDIGKDRTEVTSTRLFRTQSPINDSLINTYESIAYDMSPKNNNLVDVVSEKEYQGQQIKTDSAYKQGLNLTADSRPCYCETHSQTSRPSILKPSQQRSLNSKVDQYPVKEASSMRSKIFVNKPSQTSNSHVTEDNHLTGNNVGTHKMPLVDTSVNTLEIESVGVQAPEQDITEISSTNSTESLTSEDIICYRPIHNFCGCHNREQIRKAEQRLDHEHILSAEYALPEKNKNVRIQNVAKLNNLRNYPINTVCNKRYHSNNNADRKRYILSSQEDYVTKEMPFSRNQPISKGIFKETPENVIYCENPIQNNGTRNNRSNSLEHRNFYNKNSSLSQNNRTRNTRKKYTYHNPVTSNAENARNDYCAGTCRCCARRGDIPVVPIPPPLEYDVSCSEDDLELIIEDQSDQFFDSDDSNSLPSRYNDLPYQNSDQYINLVQELEEKLQSRNKSRVQRTLQEFERRSRLNKPLEKPVINYEETSESEEPLIRAISELARKRNEDHKNFPCKGKACCTCILPAEKNEIEIKSNYSNNKPRIKTKSHWKQDGTNGTWYRTSKNLPEHVNVTANSVNKFSHNCGCSCTCGKYP